MIDEKNERDSITEITEHHSNFEFLNSEFPKLAEWGIKAEKGYAVEPVFCVSAIQTLAEILTNFLLKYNGFVILYDNNQYSRIELLREQNIISQEQREFLDELRKTSNRIKHQGGNCSKSEALFYLKQIFEFCCWFKRMYGTDECGPSQFYEPVSPASMPPKNSEDISNKQQENINVTTLAEPASLDDIKYEENDEDKDEDEEDTENTLSPEEIDVIVTEAVAVAVAKKTLELESISEFDYAEIEADALNIFFESKNLEVIDKRSFGGCLWVVGSKPEIQEIITEACEKYNVTGAYCGGGRATGYRNAWYTKDYVEIEATTLTEFFESKNLEVIDKRPAGGCLWVVGSMTEIDEIVTEACEKYSVTGVYSGGGKATGYRNAWFTKCDA